MSREKVGSWTMCGSFSLCFLCKALASNAKLDLFSLPEDIFFAYQCQNLLSLIFFLLSSMKLGDFESVECGPHKHVSRNQKEPGSFSYQWSDLISQRSLFVPAGLVAGSNLGRGKTFSWS